MAGDKEDPKRVTIVLSPMDAAYVDELIDSGEYAGYSEIVRESLRLHRKMRAKETVKSVPEEAKV